MRRVNGAVATEHLGKFLFFDASLSPHGNHVVRYLPSAGNRVLGGTTYWQTAENAELTQPH